VIFTTRTLSQGRPHDAGCLFWERLRAPVYATITYALLLLSAGPTHAVSVDSEEVKAVLAETQWIEVKDKTHVAFGADQWRGPQDLQFKYRIKSDDGALYLWVSVIDDKIQWYGKAPLAFDHVEVWLADGDLVDAYQRRIGALRSLQKDFEERLADPDEAIDWCDQTSLLKSFAAEQKKLIARLQQEKYFTQYVFPLRDYGPHEDDPAKRRGVPRLPGEARAHYDVSTGGYELFARIPLFLACDFASATVSSVAYLVDVVDVDEADAMKQKTLLSSSARRRFGDPTTFSRLDLDAEYHLPLSDCELRQGDLATAFSDCRQRDADSGAPVCTTLDKGYWRREGEHYDYVQWGTQEWGGCVGVDRSVEPAGWVQLPEPVAIPPDYRVRVRTNFNKLLFQLGELCELVVVPDDHFHPSGDTVWSPIFHATENRQHYIVATVSGYTRWPPGAGYCGSGIDADLIWMHMQPSMQLVGLDSIRYESCFESIHEEAQEIGAHAVVIDYEQDKAPQTRLRVSYDNRKPEQGLLRETVTSTPAPQPAATKDGTAGN
jgi:hypothetical protein